MRRITTIRGALAGKSGYEGSDLRLREPERMKKPFLLTLSILALTALVASGCGRKGDPIRPSVAAQQQAAEQAGEDAEPAKPEPVRERRFILDGLLD